MIHYIVLQRVVLSENQAYAISRSRCEHSSTQNRTYENIPHIL